ncbi:cobaltochelatase subunit CobN [Deferrisoma camini]|uniref:cobaltochelatase subunit CobN n=1 Tax=Deferrisoma camini TaxID=1035120 RepID=UPI00046CFD7B|nr:cobaltochelatase subunit CobN [Deferrisoma camini]
MRTRWIPFVMPGLLGSLALATVAAGAGPRRLGLFVGDSDALTCHRAVEDLDLPGLEVRVFTGRDAGTPSFEAFVGRMDAAVVDIMHRQPAQWLLEHADRVKPGARLYAVRTASANQPFVDAGFRFDPGVRAYYAFPSEANVRNLVRLVAARDLGVTADHEPPDLPPDTFLYHPDAPGPFPDMDGYLAWYRSSGHLREGALWSLVTAFPTYVIEGKRAPLDALVRAYERRGINVAVLAGSFTTAGTEHFARLVSRSPLDARLGSVTAFNLTFSSILSSDLLSVLDRTDVPVLNAQYLFFTPGDAWAASPRGMSPAEIALQFSTPELTGLIEPTVVGVKEPVTDQAGREIGYAYVPVAAQVERLARRAARWHALRTTPNRDKRLFLMFYNHGAGKQNIGASYLNVFRSITRILERLRREGYDVGDGRISEDLVQDLLMKGARNIGSWAPGELDRLMARGDVVTVPVARYREWLRDLPPAFVAGVERDWGPPEGSTIMVKDGAFVLPVVRLGNLWLGPQPSRGWADDPEKLFHSTTLYPHHQYVAFYLWLQHELRPDALISLGTHGTHEWLPGKQAGLSPSCPPEVLLGDIPSVYPYIVDDVGEGIQAKRRGRAAVVDHATPPFRRAGLYRETATLAGLISEYRAASSDRVRDERLERIRRLARQTGLMKELGIAELDADGLETLEHHLMALRTELVPYGLHTFGESPSGEALRETAEAVAEHGGEPARAVAERLEACGPAELDRLVRALRGGYVPPGPGNDPVRNPESLPTGRNFYGFDPDKVPSREAYAAGRKAAEDLIRSYRAKHDGAFPDRVGIVLWSVETIRDEGIDVAQALHLMGMRPVWDHRDKVTGVEPIPGAALGRPRVDVLLQMSGLFRDTFPAVALLLDRAVKQAAALTDVENYVRRNTERLREALVRRGVDPEEARRLSTVRLFSAEPGAYGTQVSQMTAASGQWEDPDTIADAFIERVSFAYSSEFWGRRLTGVYRDQLAGVDATVHSISSNLYGTLDNDDMFQFLGALSMAVRRVSGKDPDVFVSMQRVRGRGRVEDLARTLGTELRARYWNPRWIEGMEAEGYAGAREIEKFVEYLWGWQVTTPAAVGEDRWEETYRVYVEDDRGLGLKAFFEKANPWAYQSITARMLEAVRKGYWDADPAVVRRLAVEHATNLLQHGVACCDHTCNNPLLNQMIVNVLSVPGVMAPELVREFKLAVERATGQTLELRAEAVKKAVARVEAGFRADAAPERPPEPEAGPEARKPADRPGEGRERVEGYRMEEVKDPADTTRLSSSGVQWLAAVFVLVLLAFFGLGTRRR